MSLSLSLRQLRYLTETARLGSMQAASRSLGVSQSSILAALDLAEMRLHARVFRRIPSRGVQPTPAGERFLASARALLAAEGEFNLRLGALADGAPPQIRVGCFEPFGPLFMTSVLRRYARETDTIGIELYEGDQRQLEGWLAAGTVDLVVAYDIGPAFAQAAQIVHAPTHAVLHADDPLAAQESVSVPELVERPIVLLDLPHTAHFLTQLFDAHGVVPNIAFRTRSYETVRSAVAEGFGASILNLRPTTVTGADTPMIVRRPIRGEVPVATLIVADSYGDLKPRFVQTFTDTLRRHFAALGPGGYAVSAEAAR